MTQFLCSLHSHLIHVEEIDGFDDVINCVTVAFVNHSSQLLTKLAPIKLFSSVGKTLPTHTQYANENQKREKPHRNNFFKSTDVIVRIYRLIYTCARCYSHFISPGSNSLVRSYLLVIIRMI